MKRPKHHLVGPLQSALSFAGASGSPRRRLTVVVKPSRSYVGLRVRAAVRGLGLEADSKKVEKPEMSKVHSRGERHTTSVILCSDACILARNESLSLIIRRAFAEHGAEVRRADAELSSRLSKAILRVIEQTGANGVDARRQAQLFATRRLLAISEPERDLSDGWGDFLTEMLGPEWISKVILDDFPGVGRINTAVEKLLGQPQWSAVHDGHMAMSCVSIRHFTVSRFSTGACRKTVQCSSLPGNQLAD